VCPRLCPAALARSNGRAGRWNDNMPKTQLRRVIYEWTAIAAATCSACCLLLWCLSVRGILKPATQHHDVYVVVGKYKYLSVDDGEITLRKQFDEGLELVDFLRRHNELGGAVDRRWRVPGAVLQYLVLPGWEPWWFFRCSLLWPAAFLALTAAMPAFRLWRMRGHLAPPEAVPNQPCPLDVPD
jgi:hypothetical protein